MNFLVFDVETQNLFEDVGGRSNIEALRVSCAVTWSSIRKDFMVYWEKDVPALITELKSVERVVGFNLKGFDYAVLRPYAPMERLQFLPTIDIMEDIYRKLGFRISLDAVAKATLGASKLADGIQAVRWWREGNLDLLAEYCKADVDVTRQIYEFGCTNHFIHYFSRLGTKLKVSVNWTG